MRVNVSYSLILGLYPGVRRGVRTSAQTALPPPVVNMVDVSYSSSGGPGPGVGKSG